MKRKEELRAQAAAAAITILVIFIIIHLVFANETVAGVLAQYPFLKTIALIAILLTGIIVCAAVIRKRCIQSQQFFGTILRVHLANKTQRNNSYVIVNAVNGTGRETLTGLKIPIPRDDARKATVGGFCAFHYSHDISPDARGIEWDYRNIRCDDIPVAAAERFALEFH